MSGKLHIEAARRWRCVIVGQTAHLAHSNQSHVLTRLMAKNVARRIKRRPGLKVAFVSSRGGAGRMRTHKVKMELRLARVAANVVAKKSLKIIGNSEGGHTSGLLWIGVNDKLEGRHWLPVVFVELRLQGSCLGWWWKSLCIYCHFLRAAAC